MLISLRRLRRAYSKYDFFNLPSQATANSFSSTLRSDEKMKCKKFDFIHFFETKCRKNAKEKVNVEKLIYFEIYFK